MNNLKRIKTRANAAGEQIAYKSSELIDKTRDQAEHLYSKGLSGIESAEKTVKKYSKHLGKEIHKHPGTFTLILIGVGCLIAASLLGKRK